MKRAEEKIRKLQAERIKRNFTIMHDLLNAGTDPTYTKFSSDTRNYCFVFLEMVLNETEAFVDKFLPKETEEK